MGLSKSMSETIRESMRVYPIQGNARFGSEPGILNIVAPRPEDACLLPTILQEPCKGARQEFSKVSLHVCLWVRSCWSRPEGVVSASTITYVAPLGLGG